MADEESRIERRKQEHEAGEEGSNFLAIAALLGIVAVVGAVGVVFFLGGGSEPDPGIYGNVTAGDGRDPVLVSAMGVREDVVTVVYYGDFDCPHCLDFEEQYMPQLIESYVAPGEVRLVFRPLRVVSRNSYRAGVAGHCVWNQSPEAYWRWHSMMFGEQRGGDWATYDQIVQYSRDVNGVDASALRDCIESGRYDSAIQRHMDEANEAGVRATPTLVINGTAVGGNDYEAVEAAIESELGNS